MTARGAGQPGSPSMVRERPRQAIEGNRRISLPERFKVEFCGPGGGPEAVDDRGVLFEVRLNWRLPTKSDAMSAFSD